MTLLMRSREYAAARAARRALLLCAALACAPVAHASSPLLLRFPTVNRTHIAFNYAGDVWTVRREGGNAQRVTAGTGEETAPHFSPDGTQIAFTADYEGSVDVFVVASAGGVPRRLTYHPAQETALGWTPDGASVLFSSAANSFTPRASQLYTVSVAGGFPVRLPLPTGEDASYAPLADRIAYVPHRQSQPAWRGYRGGQTTPIWIAELGSSAITKLPRTNSNDWSPGWLGETIYFLSDRNGPTGLYSYDLKANRVAEVLRSDGFAFETASVGPDVIVIEQLGQIKLYDPASRSVKDVPIHVQGDLPLVRPHYAKVESRHVRNVGFSASGGHAAFEAWGEIFTVPAGKGDIHNLTRSSGTADRNPAWSPDGKSIAYFSDASGEYELHIRDALGLSEVRRVRLEREPSFYYDPVWSPDGRKIAYSDKQQNLWYVNLDGEARTRVDTDRFGRLERSSFDPAWSPDSRWIGYTRRLPSRQYAIFLYSLNAKKAFQITDGMSDARHPRFDPNGKYLYFTASTDIALAVAGGAMSSFDRRVSSSVYVAVLARSEGSPLEPAHGGHERAVSRATGAQASGADMAVVVDVEGLAQRVFALPLPPRNYTDLQTGLSGFLFLSEGPLVAINRSDDAPQLLHRFDLATRKLEKIAEGINDLSVSLSGERLLYRKGAQWMTADAQAPAGAAAGGMSFHDWTVHIDPPALWRQIYDESWRIERDFFYDPGYHGLDLVAAKERYAPFLPGIAARSELSHLLREAFGELAVGHLYVRDGHQQPRTTEPTGLLGADYSVEGGRYRIDRVFDGESWNPELQAPLMQVNVEPNDYVLAVNSRQLLSTDNIYSFFAGLSGKQVVLTVGPRPDGTGARNVIVVPVADEAGLRHRAWVEDNRRRVDRATDGRAAYVYVPNTSNEGYASFNRYFFSQVDKDAAIIDERFNAGGQLPDYIIDYLNRPVMSRVVTREGVEWSNPQQAIFGPKVMIINERSGSGGDALPWYFRKAGLGPLVGKTTWGGFIGAAGTPELIDGGTVSAPNIAFYGLEGEWEVENRGVAPDHDVDLDPAAYRQGRDAQLERAIDLVKQKLAAEPPQRFKRPAYPNHHPGDASGASSSRRSESDSRRSTSGAR